MDEVKSKAAAGPNGGAAAALLAAGIGCAVFAVTVVAAEASPAWNADLVFYPPSGALSGEAVIATAVWLASWVALHLVLRGRELAPGRTLLATGTLVVFALVFTFPPVYLLFAGG